MTFKIDRNSPSYKNALELARAASRLRMDLKSARIEAGLSQQELADRIGFPLEWVSRIEPSTYDPSLAELRRYALGIGYVLEFELTKFREVEPLGEE